MKENDKAILVWINSDTYRKLKARLAMEDSTVSDWVREAMIKYVEE